jgi:RNA polymerase sigma-70 factor (ECF subfamily)
MSIDESSNPNGGGVVYSLASPGPTPEEMLQSKEQEAAIQEALGKLSKEHRSIIVLRDIEGFSYNEIAVVLGVSIGTVKSRLARARADLKNSLMRYLSVQHLR